MPPQCDGKPVKIRKQRSPRNKLSRLSLKNLTGAFVILSFGMSLSFLVFLCEKIVSMMSRNHRISLDKVVKESPPPMSNKNSTEGSSNVIEVDVIVELVLENRIDENTE